MAGVAALLTACASAPPAPEPTPPARTAWSGRLALRTEGDRAQSISARFDLQGSARQGRLDLSTPLGTTLMQAHWAPGVAILTLPDGDRRYDTMDALTADVLGEALPVASMFDWLAGQPAPGQAFETGEGGFLQAGWWVETRERPAGRLRLERRDPSPPVILRLVFDRS